MKKEINKIIAIIGPFPPYIGGTSAFLSHLVPLLELKGIECIKFNTQRGRPGRGYFERLQRFFLFLGISYKVLFSSCQIVHCHAVNWANLFGHVIIIIINRPFKKTVLTLHAGDLLSKLSGKGTRFLAKHLLKLPEVITTVTPDLQYALQDLGIKDSLFIPNELFYLNDNYGSVPEYIQKFATDHNPIIVSVGAMEKLHGIDILIRAIPYLLEKYPKVGAIIIAYKSINKIYKNEIDELISKLHLNSRIILPAHLPDVQSVEKIGDVFVRSTFSDGDSIAIREALALGRPVVASQTGYRPKNINLFPPGDYYQLAVEIDKVLSSPPKNDYPANIENTKKTIQEYMNIYSHLATTKGKN